MSNYHFNTQEFKAQVSILRVLENYLIFKKEGAYFKALCPFHHEKTPSFIVDENKGFFHCFGCNESGDVIKFVRKFKNLDFMDAVNEIAKLENIVLAFNDTSSEHYKNLDFLSKLNAFFMQQLAQNEEAKNYLFSRGLNEEDFNTFSLGYVPPFKDTLRFIDSLGERKRAYDLGLISTTQTGHEFMIFATRLSFALKDPFGRVRGFATRSFMKNIKSAKYINSRNTSVFNKSFILYGIHTAKTSSYRTKELYLMEGYFDVIAAHKLGLKNAVATCGTAFTTSHLAMIFKNIKSQELTLIFVPDKDKAGYLSVIRSLKLCFDHKHFNVKVALLNAKCKDLGEFLQLHKEAHLKEHLSFYSGFEFFLKYHLKRCENPTQKQRFLKEMMDLIKSIKQYFIKEELIKEASAIFGCEPSLFSAKNLNKNVNLSQDFNLKTCLKTALNNEEFRERFNFFIPSELLGHFAQSYRDFLTNKHLDHQLLELLDDESIRDLKPVYFTLALKNLIKTHYLKLLNEAKLAKDIKKTLQMSQKIADLAKPF